MTVILIDAKNMLFRFGWVFKDLRSEDGVFTGACYGMLKTLLRLKAKYSDSKFVLVWDGPGPGWRNKFWPDYKANRKKDAEIPIEVQRIFNQQDRIAELSRLLEIPQFKVQGVEGDDGISLLAHRCINGLKYKVVIYSSDRDFIQLMPLGAKIIHDTDAAISKAWVESKFRCPPENVLLVRAIAGDSSDGIPGVLDGVGVVRAAALINAGLNPSYSDFDMHDLRTQRSMKHVRNCWDCVHRNFRLMQLLDFPLMEKVYDDDTCHLIYTSVEQVLSYLRPNTRTLSEYRKFLGVLGQMDLVEAVSDRYRLWQIQRILSLSNAV